MSAWRDVASVDNLAIWQQRHPALRVMFVSETAIRIGALSSHGMSRTTPRSRESYGVPEWVNKGCCREVIEMPTSR